MAGDGIAEPLRELLGQAVDGWTALGFERIKERTVRSVFRGALGEIPVHVKLFRADKLSDRARDSLRGERGRREFQHLLRARALGLPAAEPLAFGMARDGDTLRSFVVTRTVEAGVPFDFEMDKTTHHRTGALLRQVHDCGARTTDLHPGNLLIDDAGDPWLVDLTSFRHAGDPRLAQRAHGLALFCQALDGGALDDRARHLLEGYRAAAPLPLAPDFLEHLALATRRWRANALPAFGRRSTRDCRHTATDARRSGQPRWFWHLPQLDAATRERCRAFAEEPPEPTRSGRRGAVWLTDELAVKQRDRGAARKLWRASYWLLFAGVEAPRPIALDLQADCGLVFTARIDNESLAAELSRGALDAATITACAGALGYSVGRLHAHGLRNRDLKFSNLVRLPDTHRIAMVDLDGVRRKPVLDTRGHGADLGRLLAAFREAGAPGNGKTLRAFLRGWLRAHRDLLQRAPWRRLLRRAEQRAAEWARTHET